MKATRRGFLSLLGGTAIAPLLPPIEAKAAVIPEVVELPGVVNGVTAIARMGRILVNWDPIPDAKYYEILVDHGGTLKRVKTTDGKVELAGKAGQTHFIRVRGVMATGDKTTGAGVSVTVPKRRDMINAYWSDNEGLARIYKMREEEDW